MPEEIPLDSLPIISNRAYGMAEYGTERSRRVKRGSISTAIAFGTDRRTGEWVEIQIDENGYVVLSPQSIQAIVDAVLKAVLADQPGG